MYCSSDYTHVKILAQNCFYCRKHFDNSVSRNTTLHGDNEREKGGLALYVFRELKMIQITMILYLFLFFLHKIHIKKDVDSDGITFQYHTVRKGVHESNSLFDLFTHLHFLERLWYKKRGKEEDFLEMDKRKILKHFRSRADVFK